MIRQIQKTRRRSLSIAVLAVFLPIVLLSSSLRLPSLFILAVTLSELWMLGRLQASLWASDSRFFSAFALQTLTRVLLFGVAAAWSSRSGSMKPLVWGASLIVFLSILQLPFIHQETRGFQRTA